MKLEELLRKAIASKASDMHLTTGVKPAVRINHEIKFIQLPEITNKQMDEFLTEIMPKERRDTLKEQFAIDFSYEDSAGNRYRINAFNAQNGISLAIRLIPKGIPTLSKLEVPTVIERLTQLESGLILVTGPINSGKSTTLAAMIEQINQNYNRRIITIEDPVEYRLENKKSLISQREIGTTAASFHGALRSALREDADVIMVGELRDLATIRLALTAAETGHLVLASLHTNSAVSTIKHIIDIFPHAEREVITALLARILRASITQRLLPRIDTKGLICVYEVLIATTQISNLIREGKLKQIPSTIQLASKSGMIEMKDYVAKLVRSGKVDKHMLELIDESQNVFDLFRHKLSGADAAQEAYKEDDF